MFRKLKEEGMSVRTIVKRYGVSRNTVKKYMDSRILPKYTRRKRGSSIDAYKTEIRDLNVMFFSS
ncbi:MAG: helix-turn-helix domain-containing protein [Thermoplasmataceae archaeon]